MANWTISGNPPPGRREALMVDDSSQRNPNPRREYKFVDDGYFDEMFVRKLWTSAKWIATLDLTNDGKRALRFWEKSTHEKVFYQPEDIAIGDLVELETFLDGTRYLFRVVDVIGDNISVRLIGVDDA